MGNLRLTLTGNENEVGQGIKDSGVPREEIFLTSKLWNTHHPNVEEGLEKTLTALGVDYLDLYVILYRLVITAIPRWNSMTKSELTILRLPACSLARSISPRKLNNVSLLRLHTYLLHLRMSLISCFP